MASVSFTLQMDPDLKQQLEDLAKLDKRPAADILHQAVETYVDRQQSFDAMVDRLSEEADKGEFVSSASMRAWFASLGTEHELPEPQPDVFVGRSASQK